MARKQVPNSKKSKSAGISLPPEVKASAARLAFKRGMSLSQLVRGLLVEAINEEAAK